MRINPTLFTISVIFIASCVQVSYLPTDDASTYLPTTSLKVYWEKPDIPYTVIGMLTVEGDGEEQLFAALKKKALSIGAHGIIMRLPTQQTETRGVFFHGSGTIVSDKFNRLEAIAIRFMQN